MGLSRDLVVAIFSLILRLEETAAPTPSALLEKWFDWISKVQGSFHCILKPSNYCREEALLPIPYQPPKPSSGEKEVRVAMDRVCNDRLRSGPRTQASSPTITKYRFK